MECMKVRDKSELEAELREHIETIRASKRGEGQYDVDGMLEWTRDVVVHLQDYTKNMVCHNLTAPFVVAAMRMVADSVCEAYEADMVGFAGVAENVQEFLRETMCLVRMKVPDVDDAGDKEGDESHGE